MRLGAAFEPRHQCLHHCAIRPEAPGGRRRNPNLTVVEANLLSLGDQDRQRHVRGSDAVISCLDLVDVKFGIAG